ncbi:MAG TPA: hypothetical protein VGO93_19060, partial [Candidatus Xenobia bacterium]
MERPRTPFIAGAVLVGLLLAAGVVPRIRARTLLQEDMAANSGTPRVLVVHAKRVADAGLVLPAA